MNELSPDMRNHMRQELKPPSMTLIIVTYNKETLFSEARTGAVKASENI
jgi:hypothetical protein